MKLTYVDVDAFVATHEFNEIGNSDWFRLRPVRGGAGFDARSYISPGSFFTRRRFTPLEIISFMSGFNEVEGAFQCRPIDPA